MEFEIGDLDEEQCKDIYAHFGLASYHAQCLETSIGLFLLLNARLTNSSFYQQDFEAMEASLQKKTMGALIKELRNHLRMDQTYEEWVEKALDRRNFLTHHFFRERAVHFLSENGRLKMLEELVEIGNDLKRADVIMVAMYTAMSKAMGVTDNILKEEWAKLRAEAYAITVETSD